MGSKYATTARIASRQHGRVGRAQLLAAGVDRFTIQRWLTDGRLQMVHRGVYAVGHGAPSVDADYMAAVLAAGEGAALSHRPGAYKLVLLRGIPRRRPDHHGAADAARYRARALLRATRPCLP
jgi:hypothetical protein